MKISSAIRAIKYKYIHKSLLYLNRNNSRTKQYQEEAYKILAPKVEKLPEQIAFRPKFIKQSFCVKILGKMYIFISKSNLNKPDESKFDAIFHEIGHWIHFQNMPPLEQRKAIWNNVNIDIIKNDVSDYATGSQDGIEFVAEVFKEKIKGKKFNTYIEELYNQFNGPKVK